MNPELVKVRERNGKQPSPSVEDITARHSTSMFSGGIMQFHTSVPSMPFHTWMRRC